MPLFENNLSPYLTIVEATEPAAPSAGQQRLYIDSTTHKLKRTDSSGVDVTIESAGSGNVATDTIFDAKGDLAVGTGADTAAKLTVGANGKLLVADSSQSTGLAWIAVPVSGSVVGDGSGDITNNTTGSWTDITAASITITTLARHVMLHFNGTVSNGTADALNSFQFLIDASPLTGTGTLGDIRSADHTATESQAVSMSLRSPSALSAASHTFKVQWRPSAGTATLKNASASTVWSFAVQELWD